MLKIYFGTDEIQASNELGLEYLEFPDFVFDDIITDIDVSKDEWFLRVLKDIDNADMPFKNVVRDIPTEDTHNIHEVSTGVKVLWLMAKGYKYLYPSQWLGQNCYAELFRIAEMTDIYLLDDSNMFANDEADLLVGEFLDLRTNEVIKVEDGSGWDYVLETGYY